MRRPRLNFRFRRLHVALVVMGGATVVSAFLAGVGSAAKPPPTPTTLATFSTPGSYTWTVPAKVKSVTFDVFGAHGGQVVEDTQPLPTLIAVGGGGGEAKASFAVLPGDPFEIVIGGHGSDAHNETGGAGGFNGGGNGDGGGGGFRCCPNTVFFGGGGGGGASDVRINRANCATTLTCALTDRIVVGGGGGGGAGDYSGGFDDGGAGGGLSGGTGGDSSAATQSSGGACIYPDGSFTNGAFGVGGVGNVGGGGGGGWYGGGGGCTGHTQPGSGDPSMGQGSSGGGGSGFLTSTSKSGSFPGGSSPSTTDDGYITVTTP